MKLILYFIFLFHASAQAIEGIGPELSFVDGCKVSTIDFRESKTFPGIRCIFFPDGSFVSSSDHTLRYLSANGAVVWEHKDPWVTP